MWSIAILVFAAISAVCQTRPHLADRDSGEQTHAPRLRGFEHLLGEPLPSLNENPTIFKGNRIIMLVGDGTWNCSDPGMLLKVMGNLTELRRVVDKCFIASSEDLSPSDIESGEDNSTSVNHLNLVVAKRETANISVEETESSQNGIRMRYIATSSSSVSTGSPAGEK
ncbi:uncharacterized protein LOC111242944 [Varroa destructor]|uniref:Uncharacterized protein n=1 Tax=Varroa destructor TaxID=109461 RepID=A0A7M7M8E8_VARDE|nr:uncharacterized protein LOC111242944 [Varroa destructor]